jgi:hypothetical protein
MSDYGRERRVNVRPVRVHCSCAVDGCDGEMLNTGRSFTTLHTEWEHACSRCGRVEWFRVSYPYVRFEDMP